VPVGSSGSALNPPARGCANGLVRKSSTGGGRRLTSRRGVLIEADAKIPTLEREYTGGRRRFFFDLEGVALPR
jgi:hypothetical protein